MKWNSALHILTTAVRVLPRAGCSALVGNFGLFDGVGAPIVVFNCSEAMTEAYKHVALAYCVLVDHCSIALSNPCYVIFERALVSMPPWATHLKMPQVAKMA